MILEDFLNLTLAEVLALHDPRRARSGASVDAITAALRALEKRVARLERRQPGQRIDQ